MLHTSRIKEGILSIPKKLISFKNKSLEGDIGRPIQGETCQGLISYVLLQGFLIFFGLCLLDWFLFYNITFLVASWMRCMSLLFLLVFFLFAGFDMLGTQATSNEYVHIKKSMSFLIIALCILIAAYNMKSSYFEDDLLVSHVLSFGYVFVAMGGVGLYLYYKHKWGYRYLWLKALCAPLLIWVIYAIYSIYHIWGTHPF